MCALRALTIAVVAARLEVGAVVQLFGEREVEEGFPDGELRVNFGLREAEVRYVLGIFVRGCVEIRDDVTCEKADFVDGFEELGRELLLAAWGVEEGEVECH
jgi:hypothetical protein